MNATSRTPFATLLIIAANIAAAFLLFLQPDLVDQFGFIASKPTVVAAVACLFLHANLLHLLGNMVFLAAAGPATELAVGTFRFFGVYLAGGLAGVAAHWALSGSRTEPLIGASGAVTACVALGAVRFYRTKVPVAPAVSVPLFSIVVVWLLLQVAGGMIRLGEQMGGTSYWAHVGGALAGFLLAIAYKAPKEADRRESERLLGEMTERGPSATLAAAEKHLASHPKDPRVILKKAEALAKLGDKPKASAAFLEAIELSPSSEQIEIVEMAIAGACLADMPSMKKTMLAERLRSEDKNIAAALLESVVLGPKDDSQRPDAILALVDLQREKDPDKAKQLVAELHERYPLHPATEIAKAKGWTP